MERQKLPNDYFPHDFNARIDRKILRCRKVLGIEGYGIYWMLIETLCTQENFSYPLKDVDLLADDFGCSVEKVEAVIKQFELFEIDKKGLFFSYSLMARLQKYLDISEKARASINVRWQRVRKLKELQEKNTGVLQTNNDGNTIIEYNIIEDNIIEDKEEKKHPPIKKFIKPTIEEIEIYAKSINYKINGNIFLDHYEAKGWLIGKSKMKDWKAAVRTWKNRDVKPEDKKHNSAIMKEMYGL